MKPTIQSDADIARIVEAFYRDITDDPVIGPYFEAVDMETHLPQLCAFWSSIVFKRAAYDGRPFEKHVMLEGLQRPHFHQWLQRFEATVDAHYTGERAEDMKARAHQIATIFQIKLDISTADSAGAEA